RAYAVGIVQHFDREHGLAQVVGRDHAELAEERRQRGLFRQAVGDLGAQGRAGVAAGVPGDGHVAEVDLTGSGNARVERVADLADTLFEADAAQLQGLDAVGLAGHDLDLDLLLDAPVALEARILLVGDEIRRLLEVLDGHVDRLRQLELVRLDHLDRGIAQDELIAPAVDAVARRHLEAQVALAARLDPESTTG